MSYFSTREELQELADEEILARSVKEPSVFAVILDRYQDPFMRKARSIIHNEEDAEEIVLDTFTKIYLNADRFVSRPGASFSSWAYRILMNTAFTRYQKRVKDGQRYINIDPEFEQFLGERKLHSGFEEDRDIIERVLVKMPGHLAKVLRLHYLEHWSQEDIARQSGESVGAIKARIHRAKAFFRGKWDDLR